MVRDPIRHDRSIVLNNPTAYVIAVLTVYVLTVAQQSLKKSMAHFRSISVNSRRSIMDALNITNFGTLGRSSLPQHSGRVPSSIGPFRSPRSDGKLSVSAWTAPAETGVKDTYEV